MQHFLNGVLQRQAALSKRVLEGSATNEERDELASIVAAVDAAAKAPASEGRFETMKLGAFRAWADARLAQLTEHPDAQGLAAMRRNLGVVAALKAGGAADDAVVAVEVPAGAPGGDPMAVLADRVKRLEDAMKAPFDGRTNTGLPKPAAPAAAPAPAAAAPAEPAKVDPPAAAPAAPAPAAPAAAAPATDPAAVAAPAAPVATPPAEPAKDAAPPAAAPAADGTAKGAKPYIWSVTDLGKRETPEESYTRMRKLAGPR